MDDRDAQQPFAAAPAQQDSAFSAWLEAVDVLLEAGSITASDIQEVLKIGRHLLPDTQTLPAGSAGAQFREDMSLIESECAFRQPAETLAFLYGHPHVAVPLRAVLQFASAAQSVNGPVMLQLFIDPEDGQTQLVALLGVEGNATSALSILTDIDERILLPASDPSIRGDLIVEVIPHE